MRTKYKIVLRKPAKHAIWSGPESTRGIIPTAEDDKARTRREALENQLKNFAEGEETVIFRPRSYCYFAYLNEEQKSIVAQHLSVRSINEV